MNDFISDFLSSGVGFSTGVLDTRKIDSNIRLLREQEWFKKIYENNQYYSLLIGNREVRAYLQSNFRVKRMIRNEKSQAKFLLLLNEKLKI
ncbi:hypothetical protein [Priestia aryabhattai]|uniref:hypothetical protein n=1 Tax=Priestia aryabhattai TaxID=412384 RepID=UPI0015F4881B|nr:hypothetical protein [Priestia aryabhattai]MED4261683.1 hypothetical protein [Priestia aryabhattai]